MSGTCGSQGLHAGHLLLVSCFNGSRSMTVPGIMGAPRPSISMAVAMSRGCWTWGLVGGSPFMGVKAGKA